MRQKMNPSSDGRDKVLLLANGPLARRRLVDQTVLDDVARASFQNQTSWSAQPQDATNITRRRYSN